MPRQPAVSLPVRKKHIQFRKATLAWQFWTHTHTPCHFPHKYTLTHTHYWLVLKSYCIGLPFLLPPAPPLLKDDQTVLQKYGVMVLQHYLSVLFMLFLLNRNILYLMFDHRRSYLLIMNKLLDCQNLASGHLKVPIYDCKIFEKWFRVTLGYTKYSPHQHHMQFLFVHDTIRQEGKARRQLLLFHDGSCWLSACGPGSVQCSHLKLKYPCVSGQLFCSV